MRKDLVKIIKYCESEMKQNINLSRAIQHAPDSLYAGYRAKIETYQSVIDKIREYNPNRRRKVQ